LARRRVTQHTFDPEFGLERYVEARPEALRKPVSWIELGIGHGVHRVRYGVKPRLGHSGAAKLKVDESLVAQAG
jgi:hypothetical protein